MVWSWKPFNHLWTQLCHEWCCEDRRTCKRNWGSAAQNASWIFKTQHESLNNQFHDKPITFTWCSAGQCVVFALFFNVLVKHSVVCWWFKSIIHLVVASKRYQQDLLVFNKKKLAWLAIIIKLCFQHAGRVACIVFSPHEGLCVVRPYSGHKIT